MTENERFGHVFAKTGSINSGTGQLRLRHWLSFFWRAFFCLGLDLFPLTQLNPYKIQTRNTSLNHSRNPTVCCYTVKQRYLDLDKVIVNYAGDERGPAGGPEG
jgi:hypothetical protein